MHLPVRIVHVFGRLDRGGAETMIMTLYRNIDRTKVQFDFIVHTQDKCDYDEEIEKLGGKIYRVPRFNGKNYFEYKRECNKFFRDHKEYKIIHGHIPSTAAIYLNIAKKHGLTTISHSHSTSSGKGFLGLVKNIMQRPIRFKADYLFACSNVAGEWLYGKKAVNQENFKVINNAIDAENFIYDEKIRGLIRNEFGLKDKFVIGHIGRFNHSKNHMFLLDVFNIIYKNRKDAVLLLIGEGELRSKIEEKINELDLKNNVILTGVRSDIPDLLQAMDVFLFPSLYEGLGIVAIEVQAAGLPCFISDVIPDEVAITNLVQKISLTKSKDYWAEEILKYYYGCVRENMYEEVCKAGYDIKENVKWFERFYNF